MDIDFGAGTQTLERGGLSNAVARWATLTELVDAAMNGEVARLGTHFGHRVLTGSGESSA